MDVAQIIGTSSAPPQREPDTRDTDYDDYAKEDFASYLDDREDRPDNRPDPAPAASAPKETAPAKEPEQASTPDAETNTSGTTAYKGEAPEDSVPADTKTADTKAEPTPSQVATPDATPVAVVAPAAPTPASAAPAEAAAAATKTTEAAASAVAGAAADPKGAASAADTTAKASEGAAPAAAQKAATTAAAAVVPPAQTESKPKAASQTAAAPKAEAAPEKPAAVFTAENATRPQSTEALEKIRTDANARLAEKDILSTKITELLHSSKGKVSLTPAAAKSSFQSALASTTNIVSAAMADTGSVAGAMTSQLGMADVVTGQAFAAVAPDGVAAVKEGTPTVVPTTVGAVQGVDSAAANTASQTANAMRAAGQAGVSDQVAMQMSNAAKDGVDRIKINLHPSELGRVEVKMELGHDGRVQAVINADKPETLDILKQDARALEKALQDAGFDTGSGSLKFGLSEQGGGDNPSFAEAGEDGTDLAGDLPLETQMPPELAAAHAGDGSLDIQV